ncbi:MAG: tripartite tricarboxylate transporter permease [Spirochaetales bacterium]|jgi:putative tricarboxylic transport membrane protein|nr:tripartite tricarboxylate transporter permease [Spirochaetales bacterium]
MEAIILGFQMLFSHPSVTLLMVFGVFFGIIFGAIPGLTATLGVMLMIPFTFTMTAAQGLALLVGIYVGGISGGLITATLINIPGTPSSIVTCWDGYPMAKNGKPSEALAIGVFASLVGGTFSAVALFTIAPQLSRVALMLGSWDLFAVCLMGLAIVAVMTSEDIIKGLLGTLIGLLLGTVGMDLVLGVSRLTFGFRQLQGGIQATALMMSLFAIREIMDQVVHLKEKPPKMTLNKISFLPPFKEMKGCIKALGIGSLCGTFIGILPGIGQNASTILAYNQAKAVSKRPEFFGKGNPEGICASESSNNAVNGGALIPLVTLGIPGDMVTAALIGGLMIQGLQPGPLLFTTNADIVGTIMVVYFLANIVMYVMELGLMKVIIKIIEVKLSFLFPAVILFCVLGVFALNNRVFDIGILIVFAVAGYILNQFKIDLVSIILGFILGPLVEKYFKIALIREEGNLASIFTYPVASVCLGISVLFLFSPLIMKGVRALVRKKSAV